MKTSNKDLISKTLATRMMACIDEYEAIKRKESKLFKTVKQFCEFNRFSHQNFMKIYHRYKQNPCEYNLLPQKRGPKFQIRRTDLNVEKLIIELRLQGNSRYEIKEILKQKDYLVAPSPTTIYNICRKHGLNRLKKSEKTERRKIIMSKIGELVHIDCHQLSKGITIAEPDKTYYLLGVLDDYSRTCWVELMEDKKSLTVMFAVLKAFNMLKHRYGIEIESVMTDNGAEFGSGKDKKNKDEHPFERLLMEMEMKHIYTKPYRPQTNGKIERFWKTLKEDFTEDSLFNDKDDLKDELLGFIAYYNEHRPHSSLNGKTPQEICKKCN
jgi:transposase InsO family protein